MPTKDSLTMNGVSLTYSTNYLGEIIYAFNSTVVNENHVTFNIVEDDENYNVVLTRMDQDSVWEVASGDYYDLDELYEEASDATEVSSLSRSSITEAQITPLCDISLESESFSPPKMGLLHRAPPAFNF